MSQTKHWFFGIGLSLLLFFCVRSLPVSASNVALGTGEISFSQKFETDDDNAEDNFTYHLTPLEAGNPMPEGTEDSIYAFSVKGTARVSAPIVFEHPGFYTYKLEQVIGSKTKGYTFDRASYVFEVDVSANRDEVLIIVKDEAGYKRKNITFTNNYQAPLPVIETLTDVPKKGKLPQTGGVTQSFLAAGILLIFSAAMSHKFKNIKNKTGFFSEKQ